MTEQKAFQMWFATMQRRSVKASRLRSVSLSLSASGVLGGFPFSPRILGVFTFALTSRRNSGVFSYDGESSGTRAGAWSFIFGVVPVGFVFGDAGSTATWLGSRALFGVNSGTSSGCSS